MIAKEREMARLKGGIQCSVSSVQRIGHRDAEAQREFAAGQHAGGTVRAALALAP